MQTIYLVPHSHYDVAWALTKDEYPRQEAIKCTKEYWFHWIAQN
jgi:hypothetical protein